MLRQRPTLQLILDVPQFALAEGCVLALQSRSPRSTDGRAGGDQEQTQLR